MRYRARCHWPPVLRPFAGDDGDLGWNVKVSLLNGRRPYVTTFPGVRGVDGEVEGMQLARTLEDCCLRVVNRPRLRDVMKSVLNLESPVCRALHEKTRL